MVTMLFRTRAGGEQSPPQGPHLTDIHAGILRVLDSGGVDWPATLVAAQQLAAAGIARVVVTVDGLSHDDLERRNRQLQRLLAQHALPLETVAAPTLRFDNTVLARVAESQRRRPGVLAHYVLLRPPPIPASPMVEVVERLIQMQLRPVLVSPERAAAFRASPKRLGQLVRSGCLVQISAASVTRGDERLQSLCRRWIRDGFCHFVASGDGGGEELARSALVTQCEASARGEAGTPCASLAGRELDAAEEWVRREISGEWATKLFRTNPGDLFLGQPIERTRPAARLGDRIVDRVRAGWGATALLRWRVASAHRHGWA